MSQPGSSQGGGPSKKSGTSHADWDYFTVDEDNSRYAACNNCPKKISRGSDVPKLMTMTGLDRHLKATHGDLHKEYMEKKATGRKPSTS